MQKTKRIVFKQHLRKSEGIEIVWNNSSSEDESTCYNKLPDFYSIKKYNSLNYDTVNVETSDKDNFISPLISCSFVHSERISPELTKKSALYESSLSPIVEKRRVQLRNRKRIRRNLSPEMTVLQGTQCIEISSPSKELSSQLVPQIEQFPSQSRTQLVQPNLEWNNLYFIPPKKRKKFKKGSLTYKIYKSLKGAHNRTKFWYHEKSCDIDSTLNNQEHNIIFRISDVQKEYGSTLISCDMVEIVGNEDSVNCKFADTKLMLINVGINFILCFEWEKDELYRLYLPYKACKLIYNNKEVVYFSNVSRILKNKEL